ncbi:MAG TPA: mannose-1-phosphate guanylyltransferase [Candidatus Didemnitutus sp.]|nr:mannose-1-phosphate guanylyltransferase [Candidatus Didemnitutus sp.]
MGDRYIVIMAGGSGERFWPQSRRNRPKHLLPIVGERSMLAQTVERVAQSVPRENICVITTRAQFDGCRAACPDLPAGNIVAEHVGRDTAAATGVAMLLVKRLNPQAAFAMLPADHVIHNTAEYNSVLSSAFAAAESDDVLVTLGIPPTGPETGFGYIQRGETWRQFDGRNVFRIRRFVEKPNLATATGYLSSGDYFWNAGMFVWRVPVVAEAFARHAPDLSAGLDQLEQAAQQGSWDDALRDIHPSLPKISVDYALMEKSSNAVMLPATFDWDDVGAWPAVANHFPKDAAGNVIRGSGVVESGAGNIVVSEDGHLTAVVGASDLIVVHTPDATLVVPRARAQEIKKLLERLRADADKSRFL